MINIYDHMHERVIAQYPTVTNDNKGVPSKGVRFVDEKHVVVLT